MTIPNFDKKQSTISLCTLKDLKEHINTKLMYLEGLKRSYLFTVGKVILMFHLQSATFLLPNHGRVSTKN